MGRSVGTIETSVGIDEEIHAGYTMTKVVLPTVPEVKEQLLRERYSRFIHFSYIGKPIDYEQELREDLMENAARSIMRADMLIEAREEGKLIGILAYSTYTRYNASEIFEEFAARRQTIGRRDIALKHSQLDTAIGAVFIVDELVVDVSKRGNGVSELMRRSMTEEFAGQTVAEMGQIQSVSPLRQRLKLAGPTYFAGEVLNEENLPEGFSCDEFKGFAYQYVQWYANRLYGAELDRDGTIISNLFDLFAREPNLTMKEKEARAMRRILNRQNQTGQICSAIAFTIHTVPQ